MRSLLLRQRNCAQPTARRFPQHLGKCATCAKLDIPCFSRTPTFYCDSYDLLAIRLALRLSCCTSVDRLGAQLSEATAPNLRRKLFRATGSVVATLPLFAAQQLHKSNNRLILCFLTASRHPFSCAKWKLYASDQDPAAITRRTERI